MSITRTMNNQVKGKDQRLTLNSKNGGIHVGLVEEPQASPAPTEPTQLELHFNQSQSLLSQYSNQLLQQLRRAPTLEEKDQLITRFKQENAQAQEVQRQMDEVRKSLDRIRKAPSRFGRSQDQLRPTITGGVPEPIPGTTWVCPSHLSRKSL